MNQQGRKVVFSLIERYVYVTIFIPGEEWESFLETIESGISFILTVGHNRAVIEAYRGNPVSHFYSCNTTHELLSGYTQRGSFYYLVEDESYATYLYTIKIPLGFFQQNVRYCHDHVSDECQLKNGALLLKVPELIDFEILRELFFSYMSAPLDELAKGDSFGFPSLPHGIRRKLEEYGFMQIGALCNLKAHSHAMNDPLISGHMDMIQTALWKLGLDFDPDFHGFWTEHCGISS